MNLHFTGTEAMALLCQGKVAVDSILTYMPGFIDMSLKNYFGICHLICFKWEPTGKSKVVGFCRTLTANQNADL